MNKSKSYQKIVIKFLLASMIFSTCSSNALNVWHSHKDAISKIAVVLAGSTFGSMHGHAIIPAILCEGIAARMAYDNKPEGSLGFLLMGTIPVGFLLVSVASIGMVRWLIAKIAKDPLCKQELLKLYDTSYALGCVKGLVAGGFGFRNFSYNEITRTISQGDQLAE